MGQPPLINHRCESGIDYRPFGGASPETIWTRMYRYRSDLAHGGAPAFDGELRVLGSAENALHLVKRAVRAVARQALIEPQLIADLRDC